MSMLQNAMHLLECINRVKTHDDMASVMRLIAEQLGFQYFALTQHVDVIAAGASAIHIHNYPARWADFYAENALGVTDPVHRASHLTSLGFRWSKISALIPLTSGDRRQLVRGRQAGIGDGFTIPSNVGGEAPGSCTFANSADRPLREDGLVLAQLLGNYAFDAARQLWAVPKRQGAATLITDRQRDCVQWAARGKSDWETSQILGISKETVTSHIKEACARYQVNKRILLVGRTLGDGTLTISDIGGWRHPHFWE
ncbi:LuxR family transcriptional regulator [Sphingobium sp. EM0848]|uniref:LuxR family transcriptional regulator n=1 Tax=Sphingobium sp. EM0848 TaxID=2743473 RepID=UPI0021010AD8|nr:LuxR family transcriptional regulator [Sphingobium sp. EM0848]